MVKSFFRTSNGMTLVEILLAMSIFVIGLSAVMGLFHFGGGLEQDARMRAQIGPVLEDLVAEVRANAWLLDQSGQITGLKSFLAEPVTGAPGYNYQVVATPGDDPDLFVALLTVYRGTPERPLAEVPFLLPRRVPVERRLESLD
ncbi:MAG: prepilin-type N-terminal cleavage/methylation domain-containing protein [Planctomycetes bacterium]|nr:prepilin-type N-terminal cleavage/methylation domain-containing protein [Planctomycetota bacterium]